jgi:hypothetical protein
MPQEQFMKQQNNKVNPRTGTLKQTKSSFQILNRIPMKTMALVILFNLTLANLSFSQGDDSLPNNFSYAEPVSHTGSKSACCTEERPVNPYARKTAIRVSLPSVQMVNRSDREVTINLIRSLHVNRVQELSGLMRVADQAMHAFFISETSMGRTAGEMIRTADDDINLSFASEHISASTALSLSRGDRSIHEDFLAEQNGLVHRYNSLAASDEDIHSRFSQENTTISLPASYVARADEEINNNMVREAGVKIAVASSTFRK